MRRRMHYELRLTTTASGIGYFACYPMEQASFDEHLAYLRSCPLDSFMHSYLLDVMGRLDERTAGHILEMARGRDPVVVALLYEAALSFEQLRPLVAHFKRGEIEDLLEYTPLINIKSRLLDDQELHYQWIQIFGANISRHGQLPPPDAAGLSALYKKGDLLSVVPLEVHVRELCKDLASSSSVEAESMLSAEETARRALHRLQAIGVIAGSETRHISSLSPFGFLRKWGLETAVRNGRHDYTLSGIQTSYGKGLTMDAARASYAMEMVERCSSFASFGPDSILGYVKEYPIMRSRYGELGRCGRNALNPNDMRLEVPYADEPLHWMEAEELAGTELKPILVPAQCVFLFCNLDEVNLFSGLGSTGLASGNTAAQARMSALLEVIERDGEATTLYHPSRCFKVEAEDPEIRLLLENYARKGVQIQFQDMSNELSIPCYKCFVIDPQGGIIKGTGAHLDGRRALLSALMETPYPYPEGPPSSPELQGLPTIGFEDLPNYSTGNPVGDLAILERVLTAAGYRPIYVDLTRTDLNIPVVKAIVPGMELMADFDPFSRVSPRLFANYLKASTCPKA